MIGDWPISAEVDVFLVSNPIHVKFDDSIEVIDTSVGDNRVENSNY